jgi:hypothetical protein
MLPANYKIPSNSNYFRLKDGSNKFRVVGKAIVGWEYWNLENKPVRLREHPGYIPKDIRMDVDKKSGVESPSKIKHFWAFPVWNFDEERVQVMEITQSTIQDQIVAYENNTDWGDTQGYNLTITRTGTGFDTEYLVQPSPRTDLPDKARKAIQLTPVNLDALFDGKDPFGGVAAPQEGDDGLDQFDPKDLPPTA